MHGFGSVLFVVAVVVAAVCVWLQYRALNRIAFRRSMFISGMAILTGLMVGMLPTLSAAIVAICLLVIGYGFLVLMAVKSYQKLHASKR